MDIYEPAEDSCLLQKFVKERAVGRVLDMGTGSGIQALTAAESPRAREVVAVDINENAVDTLQKRVTEKRLRKVVVQQSDLFSNVSGKFNLIIFNPPYLPQDEGIEDAALYGGKNGWELSQKFFDAVSKHLIGDGGILFLFSTLTDKRKIDEMLQHRLFEFRLLGSEKLAFEELYVYEITKSLLLRELEGKLVEGVCYFAEGKRGIIYTGLYDKNKLVKSHFSRSKQKVKVAVKTVKPESKAVGRIENEVKWLKLLNKKNIGPRLLFSGEDYFVYEFVDGVEILDWLRQGSVVKLEVLRLLRDVLEQCFTMDSLGVNKEEMHHPQKHVLVTTDGPVLIDFERCNQTEKPQNVTQFVEFICRMKDELVKKDIIVGVEALRNLAREYKEVYTRQVFEEIKNVFS